MRSKKARLRDKADRAMQEYMREKNPTCIICGQPISCHHHFHVKSSCSALRYDEDNLIPVCMRCHLSFHSNRSAEYTTRLLDIKGQQWANELLEKKKALTVKPGIKYYEEIINKFK